ncbi:MAG: L-threonylcarbamoyladenylate synthase [Candidatus Izemoplasmatales bacterium]|nr:L-threonylcarbamoyladenylate synthase [bacterium]MDZ4197225.1 L-threonylcarbamoyladenylate synthase [Candidatus Izemoplasmatales bacterium]
MKQTIVYTIQDLQDPQIKQHLHDTIHRGGLVVFPTETVYGIGGNALDKLASKRIYEVKGRPSDNPLIVHIGSIDELPKYVLQIPLVSLKLMESFWPGPLTMIFEKNDVVPLETTGGLSTIAIRYPSSPVALDFIRIAKVPIAAPSANISGKPSSTEFKHVFQDLNGLVDVMIDGGPSTIGLESTVLDVTTPIPTVLRPGSVTKEMIETCLGTFVQDASEQSSIDAPKSPGMKYTHYKPSGNVMILYGNRQAVQAHVQAYMKDNPLIKTALICATDDESFYKDMLLRPLGYRNQPSQIAKQVFSALREMDEWNVQMIFIHAFSTEDIGFAIMNRLLKAAGYHIMHL